jgi:protein ImuB
VSAGVSGDTSETATVRTLVVWCPDWPVVAAGVPLGRPAVVLRGNRVVACSQAARRQGVALHQRRRDAEARCPEVVVLPEDTAAAARAFEPVAAALDVLTPRLEVVRPGCCALTTRGPSRYFGGDDALARLAARLVGEVLGERGPVRVGVADGLFAATMAARCSAETYSVISPGLSASFLGPLPLGALGRPELVDVLRRLGLQSLGDLAALPVSSVLGRFGHEGLVAHRLARGLDERPPATVPPAPDLRVAVEIDPPTERIEAAAFVARGLAGELHERLAARGSACTRLVVGAETEHGERHERIWRTEGTFTSSAIARRLRWQLEGWLHAAAGRPTGPLSLLWLVPDEVVASGGRQLALDADMVDAVAAAERAGRAVARAQGLVGVQGVLLPEWRGGRGPGERVRLVTAAAVDLTEPRPAARPGWVGEPWPGTIPDPAPARVQAEPVPVEVLDAEGRPVGVTGRGRLSAPPATLSVGGRGVAVAGTAGPWPCEERWWDPARHRRRARLQLLTAGGLAHLVVLEQGRWSLEATYD